MPSVFRLYEERLRELAMPKAFLRSAERMEGWGLVIPVAVATGILPSLHQPLDMRFPTISAPDLGRISAELLLRRNTEVVDRIVHAEGPRRYSANDVAAAVGQLCGRAVIAEAQPRSQWRDSLTRVLSPSVAALLIDLYDAHNTGGLVDIEPDANDVRYGSTELVAALRPLVPVAARHH